MYIYCRLRFSTTIGVKKFFKGVSNKFFRVYKWKNCVLIFSLESDLELRLGLSNTLKDH